MFSDRRRLRRWAAQVLLVWLFGLAMGVANACTLEESTHHHANAEAAVSLAEHHHGDEQDDSGKANCLNFCEKSSIAAPQLKVVDDGLAAFGLALTAFDTLAISGQCQPTVDRLMVNSPHLPGGPPPRIAFQRLAL